MLRTLRENIKGLYTYNLENQKRYKDLKGKSYLTSSVLQQFKKQKITTQKVLRRSRIEERSSRYVNVLTNNIK